MYENLRFGSAKTCALLLSLAAVAGFFTEPANALFTRQAAVPGNVFTTRTLIAPTNLAAAPIGHDVSLTWIPGQNGTGYSILGAANGINSNCAAAVLTSLGTSSVTSYTDPGRYLPQGTYFCYAVLTTYGTWTSQVNNPLAAAQIGFVASSIQMVNDGDHSGCSGTGDGMYGQAGYLDCGDQFVVTFDQPVDPTTGPTSTDTVCTDSSADTIVLGSMRSNPHCSANNGFNLGQLTGGTIAGKDVRFDASYSWGNGNKTVTVTIGPRITGSVYPQISAATWIFTPSTSPSKLLSASGAFHVCDTSTGGGNCTPSTSGGATLFVIRGSASPAATAARTRTPAAVPSQARPFSPTPTLLPKQTAQAVSLTRIAPTVTITPSLTATSVPPTVTWTATPSATKGAEGALPAASRAAATCSATPPPTMPTLNPMSTFTPTPTAAFTPTPTATSTPTPTATSTSRPTSTFTPTPSATSTPSPTATYVPTATRAPVPPTATESPD